MLIDPILPRFRLPEDLYGALSACRSRRYPESREELLDLCCGPERAERYEVRYRVPDLGLVTEAEVTRCRNAVAVNYPEERMRRRDPDSMLIGDELPSDKPRFSSRYGYPFAELRRETMAWLEKQDLIVMPFYAGGRRFGRPALLVCPSNAAFFALALADLQGFLPAGELSAPVQPEAVIVVAPRLTAVTRPSWVTVQMSGRSDAQLTGCSAPGGLAVTASGALMPGLSVSASRVRLIERGSARLSSAVDMIS